MPIISPLRSLLAEFSLSWLTWIFDEEIIWRRISGAPSRRAWHAWLIKKALLVYHISRSCVPWYMDLTYLFISSLFWDFRPGKTTTAGMGSFDTSQEAAMTSVNYFQKPCGDLRLVTSFGTKVFSLIILNELAESLVTRMGISWSSSATKNVLWLYIPKILRRSSQTGS